MIPQVARHVPQTQQFGNLGYVPSPFEPLPAPRRHGLAPLPFRSPRNATSSTPLAPPHRAYPVDNHNSQRSGLAYTNDSEHMLRRKTPSGTLAAGYDGTPVQWSSKAPALKHVVLPVPAGSLNSGSATTTSGSSWDCEQPMHYRDSDRRLTNITPANWLPLSNGAHPLLDHTSIHQPPPYYPLNSTQIPTVLQPAYQAAPGPTASNEGGLYGPYWPNGNFIPYRPAAFRDQGHQGHPEQDLSLHSRFQRSPHLDFSLDLVKLAANASFNVGDNGSHLHENGYVLPQTSRIAPANTPTYPSISDGGRTSAGSMINRAGNSQFKEKTLSWAHSIYVDLLAFLHQSKKDKGHGRYQSRTYSRSTIYPKPPRQPASSFMSPQLQESQTETWKPDLERTHAYRGTGMSGESYGSQSSSSFYTWQRHPELSDTKYARFSNQEIPHYVSHFQAAQLSEATPQSRAKEALEILTSLCEQSGWSWIDGMLLGGCLAYGLEEYHKALQWYSKIVELDPK